MATRNCKPDADFVRLWKTLMPGTPMPACGTGEHDTSPERENAAPPQQGQTTKPPRD